MIRSRGKRLLLSLFSNFEWAMRHTLSSVKGGRYSIQENQVGHVSGKQDWRCGLNRKSKLPCPNDSSCRPQKGDYFIKTAGR